YKPLFEAAFPGSEISADNIAKAIATYERTVVSGRAPFDTWIEGNEKAVSDAAKRGFVLFNTKALCSNCHGGRKFTDDSFNDIGMATEDVGRAKQLHEIIKMKHAFKTPGLREITHRGPYMHNGMIGTLEAVVEHYNSGGIDRPSRSDLIKPLGLSAQERSDLVGFLRTVTSDAYSTTVPRLPR